MKGQILNALAFAIAAVHAVPCTYDQLRGDFASFSLPGGGGDYYSGTRQVVSWNWAVGSDVNKILSVNILNNSHIVQPTGTIGVPVTITPTDSDQAGSIRVTLPELSAGKYVFGVEVLSDSSQCTVFSAPFEILSEDDEDDDDSDSDRCDFGDTRCAGMSTGYRSCIQTERGRRFGAFQQCNAGQLCEQAGDSAYCTLGSGGSFDRCEVGETRCARDNTGYRTCIDTANGNRFRAFRACPGGQTCIQGDKSATCALASGNGGSHSEVCYTLAEYGCVGDSFRVCQQDINGGLVWSALTKCGSGATCRIVDQNVNCVAE